MKKWIKFFFLSFFSHKLSKESSKRGYSSTFLSFVLALTFLWVAFVGGDMLPFATHYNNSTDIRATLHEVFANDDLNKRISAEIRNGVLKIAKYGEEYTEDLLVNTLHFGADKEEYSVNGYDIVVDSRSANALAQIEAYCVSNDGKNTEISYEEYLTLSEVARLNFDFKLRYTGNELELNDTMVEGYQKYLHDLGGDAKTMSERSALDLAEGVITRSEYNRAIYELYFENYYPEISSYESTSKVPLLRNYYYHNYISKGLDNYLFIFDDYMTGSFETENGISVSFYGFYTGIEDGVIVPKDATSTEADALIAEFVKDSYDAIGFLNGYAYLLNIFGLIPFIALMLMVATLLTFSLLKLKGVDSISSLGAMLKIIGSYTWFSGAVATIVTLIVAFFVDRNMINAVSIVLFFITLMIRSIIFAIKEIALYTKQLEQQEAELTEV